MINTLRWFFRTVLFLTVLTTSVLIVIVLVSLVIVSPFTCDIVTALRLMLACAFLSGLGMLAISQSWDLLFGSTTKSKSEK